LLLRIEFTHHLQQSRNFLFGEKLEQDVHGPILKRTAFPENPSSSYNGRPIPETLETSCLTAGPFLLFVPALD
jgi:hypothetical protein